MPESVFPEDIASRGVGSALCVTLERLSAVAIGAIAVQRLPTNNKYLTSISNTGQLNSLSELRGQIKAEHGGIRHVVSGRDAIHPTGPSTL